MNKNTFYITRQNATGFYGYQLLQGQNVLFSNGNPVLPDKNPVVSVEKGTNKVLTISRNSDSNHPTIVPGLKMPFNVHNEKGEVATVFEKVYGNSFNSKVNIYIGDVVLFTFYQTPIPIFISPKRKLIAYVEADLGFKYDRNSIDDEYGNYLHLVFHVLISRKLMVM